MGTYGQVAGLYKSTYKRLVGLNAIIPCAGFGTRVNMKPYEAKELLLDEQGNITIDWCLNLCRRHNLKPVIVSRPEKLEFNAYIQKQGITLVFDEGRALGESLLASRDYWSEYNVVILPDTRFEYPEDLFRDMESSMKMGNECTFGLFNVVDHKNWGIICNNTFYEKPKRVFTEEDFVMAWGVFGFTKNYGNTLLSRCNIYSEPLILTNPGYFYIDNFRDITRETK